MNGIPEVKMLDGAQGVSRSIGTEKNVISRKGENSFSWKGGRVIDGYGYALLYNPDNGQASNYTKLHIIMAEKVLGKKLPVGVVVHHSDENRLHNENSNFVICENQGYHNLLHKRMRAIEAGGANMVRCPICKEHDIPENLYIRSNGQGYHRRCHAKVECVRKRIMRAKKCHL